MEEVAKTTISRLLGIVAGKTPIPHGVEIVAQDVAIHMDGHTFYGINSWAAWIAYIRTRGRVAELDVEVDRLVAHEDGTITAHGRWRARRQGEEVSSRDVWARYRVVGGVVVEIWTTRTNYLFMLGPIMGWSAGHLLVMLHVFFWAKSFGVPDLRASAPLVTTAAPAQNTCDELQVDGAPI